MVISIVLVIVIAIVVVIVLVIVIDIVIVIITVILIVLVIARYSSTMCRFGVKENASTYHLQPSLVSCAQN